MPEFSVVTIVKGRRKQLTNLLDSITQSTIQPYDVQVVCMDHTDDIVTPDGLAVTVHDMASGDALPLAAARNRGIEAARTDRCIFIDVDCIVSPTLFENLLKTLTPDRIVAAYPLYLPIVPNDGDFERSKQLAVPHPARETLPAGVAVPHLQFWSLIFAVNKQTFKRIGGFDETFTGYGAEDTDFAMSFHAAGVEQLFVRDYVLHQYHDKYDPPLNHFQAIIANAMTYRQKWGAYPMGSWLRAFAKQGFIDFADDRPIKILRAPTQTEIQANVSKLPY